MTPWNVIYDGYDPPREGLREALCTLGNGYFATRGALAEVAADGIHYPGTYVSGLYNRLHTTIAGRTIENEDLVNLPDWLALTFRLPDGTWFDLGSVEVHEHRLDLDMRRGVLTRHTEFDLPGAGRTSLTQRRLVSMDDMHVAALETTLVAHGWSGRLVVRSGLDGGVVNGGVPRYRALANRHLDVVEHGEDDDRLHLVAQTTQSKVRIAEAARTRILTGGAWRSPPRRLVTEDGFVGHDIDVDVAADDPVTVEKVVALYTSRDRAISEPGVEAREKVARLPGFDALLARHVLAWDHLWQRFSLDLDGAQRAQQILNLHVFHLVQTVSEHTIDLDVGVPARGLHGEAYRGHIFWDELFIFPFLNLRLPVLTRALLHYRRRRLGAAQRNAEAAGYEGALYPWQSGSNGREESQRLHLNPRSGRWLPDNSHLQRHINIAVAYNMWQYYEATGDIEYLRFHVGKVLLEIARFFSSLATYNRALDRYEIRGVMGPDEFHDAYPDADEPGLNNNTYTNVMVVWVLLRALELLELLPAPHRKELWEDLGLRREEIARWEDITRKMLVVFHADGILTQFEGYEDLKEFDWESYRRRYGDIHRLDRILEAEGDTVNRYKASKQADVLMLFYVLSGQQLKELLGRLDYDFDPERDIARTVEYYLERTSHGSTLSNVVHSWVLARMDRPRSWEFFLDALESDVSDIQGGTTPEGIHLGAMAGTVDLAQRGYGGIVTRGGVLWLDPALPDELDRLGFQLHYRHHRLQVEVTADRLRVEALPSVAAPITVGHDGRTATLEAGARLEWAL